MEKNNLNDKNILSLSFDENGLLPAIVQEAETLQILMMAYINQEAFQETMQSGFATFWSRSRQELWKKGETSGNRMQIVEVRVDCDQDCVIYLVTRTQGGACHTKNVSGQYRKSCFYRKVNADDTKLLLLED
ncbi:MAG: phosphoribosyl-AMP cyclohydrolase [Bacteroidota bacterium]|nr:MAG: phosphoribosyl-AMP cyclohydrolase [Bacteroidota bacterium]